jgi:hypothetical protein
MRTLIPSLLWFSALAPACFAKGRRFVPDLAKAPTVARATHNAAQTEPTQSESPKFQSNAPQSFKKARAARRQTI